MPNSMSFSRSYLEEVAATTRQLDDKPIEELATRLAALRDRQGRLFILGVGGSAANASHAVNDFRKLCGLQCYAPTDNVAELTAWTNDEGWATSFSGWLEISRLSALDALLILSVGGGSPDANVSVNLVSAAQLAKQKGAAIFGIVGRDGGYTAQVADVAIIVPTVNPALVTPHAEEFQTVIWHLLVSHPALKLHATKW